MDLSPLLRFTIKFPVQWSPNFGITVFQQYLREFQSIDSRLSDSRIWESILIVIDAVFCYVDVYRYTIFPESPIDSLYIVTIKENKDVHLQ